MKKKKYEIERDLRYLTLLAQSFPTVAEASTEIINLQAILNLPKGTEHFLADLHGEYEAFQHVLKNASGNIKRKVNEIFGTTLREAEKRELCTLIYYPEQKLELVKESETDINDWYHITIHQLVSVCRDVSSKYTRSKVRKSLPTDFKYIIQELLHERVDDSNKAAYVNGIALVAVLGGAIILAQSFVPGATTVLRQLTRLNGVVMPMRYMWVFVAYFALRYGKEELDRHYRFTKNRGVGLFFGAWCFLVTLACCLLGMYSKDKFEMVLKIITPAVLVALGLILPILRKRENSK